MAIIRCPECKKKVSDEIPNCNKCGQPIKIVARCPKCTKAMFVNELCWHCGFKPDKIFLKNAYKSWNDYVEQAKKNLIREATAKIAPKQEETTISHYALDFDWVGLARENAEREKEEHAEKLAKKEKSRTVNVPWFAVGVATSRLKEELRQQKKRNELLEKTLLDIKKKK